MKPITYLIIITCAGLLVSCATAPPAELINARQAYQHASAGQAAQLVPAELHKAQVALAIAEKSFQDDPKSFHTRDLAYVADRKAKMAEALATTVAENAATAKANKDYQATQTEIVKNTKEALAAEQKARLEAEVRRVQDSTNAAAEAARVKEANVAEARRVKELADAEALRVKQQADAGAEARRVKESTDAEALRVKQKADADAEAQRVKESTDAEARRVRQKADAQAEQLAAEQRARLDAEKRAADAQADLAKLAAVKEEARGLVITLSGSVLFASNKSELLPAAQDRLNQVADALMATKDRKLTVEGHTDSRGSSSYNQVLSQQRADAVRSYLISHGYPSDLIQARGIGKDRPVADNASAEGRANNRRVEIIVEREAK